MTEPHPDQQLLNTMLSPWSGGSAPYNGPGALEAAGVDEDSAFTVANARIDNIMDRMQTAEEKVRLCGAWMDGLITGLRFMRTKMEPQIISAIEGNRRTGGA